MNIPAKTRLALILNVYVDLYVTQACYWTSSVRMNPTAVPEQSTEYGVRI